MLSTMSGTPARLATVATASMSVTTPPGIGDRLDEDRLGLRRHRLLEGRDVVDVRPLHVPAEALERVVELVDRAAIELARRDELVAGRHQRMEDETCAAWPEATARPAVPPSSAAIRSSSTALVGLHDARIDVAEGLQAEERRGMLDIVEDIGGGLVDRRRPRAGRRVGLGAGMNGKRGETRDAVVAHRCFSSGDGLREGGTTVSAAIRLIRAKPIRKAKSEQPPADYSAWPFGDGVAANHALRPGVIIFGAEAEVLIAGGEHRLPRRKDARIDAGPGDLAGKAGRTRSWGSGS